MHKSTSFLTLKPFQNGIKINRGEGGNKTSRCLVNQGNIKELALRYTPPTRHIDIKGCRNFKIGRAV
jgi:hypothetical protein